MGFHVTMERITEEDVLYNWPYHISYLVDILNFEYDINEAREDILSFRDSKYDNRINKNT